MGGSTAWRERVISRLAQKDPVARDDPELAEGSPQPAGRNAGAARFFCEVGDCLGVVRDGLGQTRQLAELAKLKEQIQKDKKALADLDEEARRAGVPPGWLR